VVRRPEGVFVPFKRGEIGPDLFRAACNMGLEGIVSKRRDPQSLDQSQEPQASGLSAGAGF
jgi:hypothetical protein